jgi:hypothetical protein
MVVALRQQFGGLGIVYGSGGGGWDSEEDGEDGEENITVKLSNYSAINRLPATGPRPSLT